MLCLAEQVKGRLSSGEYKGFLECMRGLKNQTMNMSKLLQVIGNYFSAPERLFLLRRCWMLYKTQFLLHNPENALKVIAPVFFEVLFVAISANICKFSVELYRNVGDCKCYFRLVASVFRVSHEVNGLFDREWVDLHTIISMFGKFSVHGWSWWWRFEQRTFYISSMRAKAHFSTSWQAKRSLAVNELI